MKLRHALVLSAALLGATAAQAQFQKPEDALKYRQSALFVMGQHFSRIGAMTSGRVRFDAKLAQENAAVVVAMSKLPWAGFTPNTENLKSNARPELWMEMDKVKAAADKMMASAVALESATKTGNLDAVKKAFGDTAASCKACHDNYRE